MPYEEPDYNLADMDVIYQFDFTSFTDDEEAGGWKVEKTLKWIMQIGRSQGILDATNQVSYWEPGGEILILEDQKKRNSLKDLERIISEFGDVVDKTLGLELEVGIWDEGQLIDTLYY